MFVSEVQDAFLSGLAVACWVAAGVALAGAIFARRFLPAHAEDSVAEAAPAEGAHALVTA